MSRGNEQGWRRHSGQKRFAVGDGGPYANSPHHGWSGCKTVSTEPFLPRVLMEVVVHPDSTSESHEAVTMEQKETETNLPSVLAMHWLRKGKRWEMEQRGVVMQGWRGCHALQGDVKLQQHYGGSRREALQLSCHTGEVILKQELWEVSGQFLVTAVTCSLCREKLLLWRSQLGLVFVTMGSIIPVIKVFVNFFM